MSTPHQARLEAARNLELEDLENHVETFYESLDPVAMVHGNITRAAALNLRTRTSSLIMADAEETEVPRSDLKRLASGSQTVETAVQHSDQGYLRYIQGADKEYETKAAYRVMAQVLSSPSTRPSAPTSRWAILFRPWLTRFLMYRHWPSSCSPRTTATRTLTQPFSLS